MTFEKEKKKTKQIKTKIKEPKRMIKKIKAENKKNAVLTDNDNSA